MAVEFDLDDLFADEFKPKKEETEKVYDENGEREFEGNVFLDPDHVFPSKEIEPLEGIVVTHTTDIIHADPILEGTVIDTDEKAPEKTALSEAVAELEKIKAEGENDQAHRNALRSKIQETRRLLESMSAELNAMEEKRYEIRRRESAQEAVISEIEHRMREAEREKEIAEQRNAAMLQFKHHIDDLNPEWKNYAFDHQWEGAANLALHKGGLLADDMGLGKSLTVIMIADMLNTKFNLVITPADTNSNFTIEWAMWAKHRFVWTLVGADKHMRNMWMDIILERVQKGEDVTLLINYEQLYADEFFFAKLQSIAWDAVFVDEFHNAKNKSGVLFDRLKKFRVRTDKFFPVTGTFILNKPEDIWTALHLVDPAAFPNLNSFRDAYCEYDWDTSSYVFRPGGEKSMLIRLGGRIVKRSMPELVAQGKMKALPKQHIHFVEMEFEGNSYPDQRKIMKQLAEHSQIILDSDRKVSIVETLALITRQRQCAVWPAGITLKDPETGEVLFSVGDEVQESIKMDWTFNWAMKLLKEGKRVAVFSQFKTALAELEERLKAENIRVVRYDGDTDRDTKMKVKKDFDRRHVMNNGGKFEWDIVLCNYKTGGVGLNFTHITDTIALDEEWNPGKNEQMYKRTCRIGQEEETHVWIPQLEGAIDGWMRSLNQIKQDMINGFDQNVDDLKTEFESFLAKVANL